MKKIIIAIITSALFIIILILPATAGVKFYKKVETKKIKGSPATPEMPEKVSGVTFYNKNIDGIPVYVINVNPKHENVLITPVFCPGYSEIDGNYPIISMKAIAKKYRPTAIVNGTFFDAGSYQTVCSVVINGKLICEGDRGSTVFLDRENNPGMILTSRLRGRNINWSNCKWAIQSGPTLIYNGRIILNPSSEGFSDPSLFRLTRRTALGVTPDGKILFVATSSAVNFNTLAKIMKKLGSIHAINMDGGSSTGIGFGGKFPVTPARALPGFVMIFAGKTGSVLPEYFDIRDLLAGRDRIYAAKFKNKADLFARKGNIAAALKYYLKSVKVIPYPETFIAAARILESCGKIKLASKYYGKASITALESGSLEAAWKLAKRSLRYNENESYAREAVKILNQYPEYTEAIKLLGRENYLEAYQIIISLLQKDSSQPRFYFALARIFSGINLDKLKARSYYLSALYFNRKQDREYESFLTAKNAVEIEPHNALYRNLLSKQAAKVGDYSAARYHKFITLQLNRDLDQKKQTALQASRL